MRAFDIPAVRPVFAGAINLLLIAIGLGAAFLLPVREYPDIDPPSVSVSTIYTGAPAEIVEREVTKIIEDNLSGIERLRYIRSISRNEVSAISLFFEAGTNIDAAAADVRDKVSAVRTELPDGIEEPAIQKASADDAPMMWITLRSDVIKPPELTDIADRRLIDAIGSVSGVSRVIIGGEKRYAMRIWLDRAAMAARGVTPDDVAARLRAENVELPTGQLETRGQEITLRAETRFSTAREFSQLTIREREGDRVRLGDVARVEVGVEDYKQSLRSDGGDAIALGIVRQSNANTLSVAGGVRAELDRLRSTIPGGVDVSIGYDESVFIRETLKNVASTLAQAVAIILVVLYAFLGSLRGTLIPAATIPASIIPAAFVAAGFGFSINVLTILAVILAISLCTDDAVVIMESIRRRQQRGEPLLLATVRATNQIGFAVFSGAIVLIAVVLPLAFLQGNIGRLFREFAVVLATIIAFSTVSALTLGPMLSTKLFDENSEPGWLERKVSAGVEWLSERYQRALRAIIRRPVLPLIVVAAVLAAGAGAYVATPSELAPDEDRGVINIVVEGPEGASAPYMSGQVAAIERSIAGLAGDGEDKPVAGNLAIVVPTFTSGQAPVNTARVIVRLKPWDERKATQDEVRRQLQTALAPVAGVKAFAVNPPKLGQRGGNRQVQFTLAGVEREPVIGWSETLLAEAQGIAGLINVDTDYKNTRPQISIGLDRDRAAALGVTAQAVGSALQIMFGSLEVTRFVDRGEEYEVILQARPEDRTTPDDLRNVFVRTANGQLIPLSSVVRTKEDATVRELRRLDRLAAVTIEANLEPGTITLGEALTRLETIAREKLPPEAQVKYQGESLDYQDTGAAVIYALLLVVVLVYLVLAAQFESFIHPLIILTSAPMALAGGLLTLWAFGLTLNIYSQIGMILLVGLVAKNAILIVEFANQLRESGKEPLDAATEAAGQRLRPILMTSVATILGAVPLILESGAGAEARTTVGAVTAGGVTFGTLLTLFIVPASYVLLARFTSAPGVIAAQLAEEEGQHPEDAGDEEPEPGPDAKTAGSGRSPAPEPARRAE